MLAEENPDLPYEFIKETLEAIEEEKAGLLVPYKLRLLMKFELFAALKAPKF